jgi:hypothetical protein
MHRLPSDLKHLATGKKEINNRPNSTKHQDANRRSDEGLELADKPDEAEFHA